MNNSELIAKKFGVTQSALEVLKYQQESGNVAAQILTQDELINAISTLPFGSARFIFGLSL